MISETPTQYPNPNPNLIKKLISQYMHPTRCRSELRYVNFIAAWLLSALLGGLPMAMIATSWQPYSFDDMLGIIAFLTVISVGLSTPYAVVMMFVITFNLSKPIHAHRRMLLTTHNIICLALVAIGILFVSSELILTVLLPYVFVGWVLIGGWRNLRTP